MLEAKSEGELADAGRTTSQIRAAYDAFNALLDWLNTLFYTAAKRGKDRDRRECEKDQ
jgi:hypothetical protein